MKTSPMNFSELITEFHRLYAQYKRPEYLEIAATLGKVQPDTFQEENERKVNEGCDHTGIPRIY